MSTLGLAARLVCVFGLLALVLWGLKRTDGLKARRRSTPLQVLSTTRLGKSASLSVVRVHDEEYVLGVTGNGVTVVTSRPSPAAEVVDEGTPAPARRPLPALPQLRKVVGLAAGTGRTSRTAAGTTAGTAAGTAAGTTAPGTAVAAPVGPPTSAQFLRDGWEVLRKRPVDAVDVSDDALATALAHARGDLESSTRSPQDLDHPVEPYDNHPLEPLLPELGPLDNLLGDAPSPTAADGSAAALPRRAPRRPRVSTDAAPREEPATWSRTRRPAFRSTEEDSVAV